MINGKPGGGEIAQAGVMKNRQANGVPLCVTLRMMDVIYGGIAEKVQWGVFFSIFGGKTLIMVKRTTSFGTMETVYAKDGEVVAEVLVFSRPGRAHVHDLWEICYVTGGHGVIVNGDEEIKVKKGQVCRIKPGTSHWMIPEDDMEVLIVYSAEIA